MRLHRSTLLLALVGLALCGCPLQGDTPNETLDGGVDGGGGITAADGGLKPLPLEFTQVIPPAQASRLGLLSDGTTIYARGTSGIEVTTDVGRSWQRRGAAPQDGQMALSGTETVWVLGTSGLYRSDDGARTFSTLALPSGLTTSSNPLLHVGSDGVVWISTQEVTPRLFRSADQGASFQPVTLPADTTVLRVCKAKGAGFVAARSAKELVRWDGTALVKLADITNPGSCLLTAAGTVLALGRDTNDFMLRIPQGAAAPERLPGISTAFFIPAGAELIRLLTGGRVERSSDDGATWTPQVTTTPEGFAINEAVATGSTLLAVTTVGLSELLSTATAWSTFENPGLPPYLRVVDLSFATASPAMALLLDDNVQRTVFVARDGVTWKRGMTLVKAQANCIALSPSGDRLFVGGIGGRWRLLTDDGSVQAREDGLGNGAGLTDVNPIQQATWQGDPTGSFVMLTTASASDTEGNVLSRDMEASLAYWRFHTPRSTTTAAAVRPGGYHALAMGIQQPGNLRRLLVSFRTFISTNAWNTDLMTWNQVFDSQGGFWVRDTPPIAFTAAISASVTDKAGGIAMLWSDRRLRVGPFPFALREVPLSGEFGEPSVVRFDAQGRLWVGTNGGLFHTATPVDSSH